jgi:hypothetical protein
MPAAAPGPQIFVQHYMSQPERMAELSALLAAGGRYELR